MSELKELNLPDIREAIYATSGRLSAAEKYIEMLKGINNLEAKQLHNKLETDYLRYIRSQTLQNYTEKLVSRIHCNAVKLLPNYSITTKSREKSLLSYVNKTFIALSEGKSLERIMDTRACRLIIDNSQAQNDEEVVKALGELVNNTLSFLLDQGFQLSPATPPKDTDGFNKKHHPDVYVPKKSYILEEYKVFVKDYVSTPKKNGYQSYHVIAIDPKGNYIEIQFRSFDMDCHSEYKVANHGQYKEEQIQKYNLKPLDRTKVHWSNYRYENFSIVNEKGEKEEKVLFADDAGLEKSLSIRTLTYNP